VCPSRRHFFPFDRGDGGVREVVPLRAAVLPIRPRLRRRKGSCGPSSGISSLTQPRPVPSGKKCTPPSPTPALTGKVAPFHAPARVREADMETQCSRCRSRRHHPRNLPEGDLRRRATPQRAARQGRRPSSGPSRRWRSAPPTSTRPCRSRHPHPDPPATDPGTTHLAAVLLRARVVAAEVLPRRLAVERAVDQQAPPDAEAARVAGCRPPSPGGTRNSLRAVDRAAQPGFCA
jgi:hypothetical protein